MTTKMVHLWHPLKQITRPEQIGQDADISSHKIFCLVNYEIIYPMRKPDSLIFFPLKNI